MKERKNIEITNIKVNRQNFFGVLARILNLFKKDLQEKTYIFDKEEILTEIIRDLRVLQKHCLIVDKNENDRKSN